MEKNTKPFMSFLKTHWKFILISVILLLSIIGSIIMVRGVSSFTLEVKEARIQFEKGVERIVEGLDEGSSKQSISLKEDAFRMIDDTNVTLDNGVDDKEIEHILNKYKLGSKANVDGKLEDSKRNAVKFNDLYNIKTGFSQHVEKIFSKNFIYRLANLWKQHIYNLNIKYYQQRDTPKVGNIICVPTSARILLSGLGYNVTIEDLLEFFKDDKELIESVKNNFGNWVNVYIKKNKLYQITGIFTHGLNMFMGRYYPEFPYRLEYDYWKVDRIIDYLDKYGVMSSTYFPRYVMEGKRKGGHMITITKVYRDINGVVIGFGINDPFGNPNAGYRGALGYDGQNVVVDYDTMLTVMKSYYDDHGYGSKSLYRVLYFVNK